MPTDRPRIQVTVDVELERALAGVDPAGRSRARVIRDLAVRGAEAERDDQRARESAIELLLAIADGDDRFDLTAAAEMHAARGDRLL